MSPVKLALWLYKFVATIALLFAVSAGILWGGAYVVASGLDRYNDWQRDKAIMKAACTENRENLQKALDAKKVGAKLPLFGALTNDFIPGAYVGPGLIEVPDKGCSGTMTNLQGKVV